MTYTIKNHTLPGSPFIADYDCTRCGRVERIVSRDENGDPPSEVECECGLMGVMCIGTPKIAFWTRTPTAINPPGSFRGEEKDPRALDTSELASGKLTQVQWRKKQREISKSRRHAKRIASGRAKKRIQVDSAGVK